MKIKVEKKKRSTTVSFHATSDGEGVDLKTVLLAAVRDHDFTPARMIDELGALGYAGEACEKSDASIDVSIERTTQ